MNEQHHTDPARFEAMRLRAQADHETRAKILSLGFVVETARTGAWRLAFPELEGQAQERFAIYCPDALAAIRGALRIIEQEKAGGITRAAWAKRQMGRQAERVRHAGDYWRGSALPVNPGAPLNDCRLHSLGRAVEPHQAVKATVRALRGIETTQAAKEGDLAASFGLAIVGPVFETETEAAEAWHHEDLAQTVRVARGWRVEFPGWMVTAKVTGRQVSGGRSPKPQTPAPAKAPGVKPGRAGPIRCG